VALLSHTRGSASFNPRQRRSIANFNGLVREHFPKGKSLTRVTQPEASLVALSLNRRPRKRLRYHSPARVFAKLTGIPATRVLYRLRRMERAEWREIFEGYGSILILLFTRFGAPQETTCSFLGDSAFVCCDRCSFVDRRPFVACQSRYWPDCLPRPVVSRPWQTWIKWAYGASFDRPTEGHFPAAVLKLIEIRYVVENLLKLVTARVLYRECA
jgi:hypothetical protein